MSGTDTTSRYEIVPLFRKPGRARGPAVREAAKIDRKAAETAAKLKAAEDARVELLNKTVDTWQPITPDVKFIRLGNEIIQVGRDDVMAAVLARR